MQGGACVLPLRKGHPNAGLKRTREGAMKLMEQQRSLQVLFIFRSDDSLLRANRTRIFIEN